MKRDETMREGMGVGGGGEYRPSEDSKGDVVSR